MVVIRIGLCATVMPPPLPHSDGNRNATCGHAHSIPYQITTTSYLPAHNPWNFASLFSENTTFLFSEITTCLIADFDTLLFSGYNHKVHLSDKVVTLPCKLARSLKKSGFFSSVQALPLGFFHCYRCRQPACDLLTLPSVT